MGRSKNGGKKMRKMQKGSPDDPVASGSKVAPREKYKRPEWCLLKTAAVYARECTGSTGKSDEGKSKATSRKIKNGFAVECLKHGLVARTREWQFTPRDLAPPCFWNYARLDKQRDVWDCFLRNLGQSNRSPFFFLFRSLSLSILALSVSRKRQAMHAETHAINLPGFVGVNAARFIALERGERRTPSR